MKQLLTSLLLVLTLLALAVLVLGRFAPKVEAAADRPAAEAAPGPQGSGAGLDEDTFFPTEKLSADSNISFPVDI